MLSQTTEDQYEFAVTHDQDEQVQDDLAELFNYDLVELFNHDFSFVHLEHPHLRLSNYFILFYFISLLFYILCFSFQFNMNCFHYKFHYCYMKLILST